MKKTLYFVLLVLLVNIFACELTSSESTDKPVKTITVESITPAENSIIDSNTQFTIIINYNLKGDRLYKATNQYEVGVYLTGGSSILSVYSELLNNTSETGTMTLTFSIDELLIDNADKPYKLHLIMSNNTDDYLFGETEKYIYN